MKFTNEMIEHRLKRSIEAETPNVLSDILQTIETNKGGTEMNNNINESKTITNELENKRNEKRMGNRWMKWAASVAAVFVVVFTAYFVDANYNPQSTIAFDVNPSIELKVSKSEKIIDVVPLNDEGETVIGDMDLKRVDLDTGVNALVGSMVKNGYISEIKNSILISVDSKDEQKGIQLQEHLTSEVNSLLSSFNVDGAILAQRVSDDDRIKGLAEEYNISFGKAALIDLFVSQNDTLRYEDLAKLSINDINLLAGSAHNKPENVNSSGQASSAQYIGKDKAKAIAFSHAGINESDIRELEIEMDYDDGRMIYEVEFEVGDRDFEYDIDARDGTILEYDIDGVKNAPSTKPSTGTGNTGSSGSGSSGSNTGSGTSTSKQLIGAEKAKSIAYSHAGVSASNVRDLEVELDSDDGRRIYEIEFDAGSKEYEYDIDAYTGTIIKFEIDDDDDDSSRRPSTNTSTASTTKPSTTTTTTKPAATTTPKPAATTKEVIGAEKAKSIAFSHAGVSASNVRDLEVELDDDDGRKIYEIDFEVGEWEYEYDIDAYTGSILKSEKDD